MASLKFDSQSRKATIQFRDAERCRRTIRLSKVSKTFAERFHSAIERLNDAQRIGGGLDLHTTSFVSELGDVFFDKLVRVNLLEPRTRTPRKSDAGLVKELASQSMTLERFMVDYLKRRTDLKSTSLLVYEGVQRYLMMHFDADKRLTEITAGDAVDFGRFMHSKKLSRTTIDRRMSLASTMFNDAVRHEFIEKNPFDGWRKPLKNLISRTNKSRQRFIGREDFDRLIEKAPDAEFRLLLVLARFGGLRTPSEPLSLQWGHIDYERSVIRVPCPKMEHVEGRESREVPLFPEIRPFLQEVYDLAEPGMEWIICRHRPKSVRNGDGWKNANLRTALSRIYVRAGLKVPTIPWNNMRASRATELAEDYPGHVAAAWLGHTEEIANAHYRQVLPEHIEKAISDGGVMPPVMPLAAVLPGMDPQAEKQPSSQLEAAQKETAARDGVQPSSMEAAGIEPASCCPSVKASTCVVC